MTTTQILDMLMLLSALESWGLSQSQRMPDYLHDRIDGAVRNLRQMLEDGKASEAIAAVMIRADVISTEAKGRYTNQSSAQAFADGAIYAQMTVLESLQKGGATC